MPNINSFLFDLDGTLIDSVELISSSFRHTLGTHLNPPPRDEAWLATLGQPLWDQFALFTGDKKLIDEMIATYREHNIANHDQLMREYPGVRDAVTRIHRAGRTLGVVTSKLHDMAVRGLERCGYGSMFSVVIGADDVARHKPDPEPVLKALRELDLVAADTIYVGDSPYDMLSGRAAGTLTGAVLWGPFTREALADTHPDFWIRDPQDLVALLQR